MPHEELSSVLSSRLCGGLESGAWHVTEPLATFVHSVVHNEGEVCRSSIVLQPHIFDKSSDPKL